MLQFGIKIVIGLCSIAVVIGLALAMEYEWGQLKGSNSFLEWQHLGLWNEKNKKKIKAHSKNKCT